jgi:hypothetical protein
LDAWRISWTVTPSTVFASVSACERRSAFVASISRGSIRTPCGWRVGAQRLAARKQEVTGVAVLHLHFIADGAELLDALEQDDLHVSRAPYFTT